MIKYIMIAAAMFTASSAAAFELDTSPKQMECLAKNVYFEGRNQSVPGQHAIAMVTLNRVFDSRFPNTICEVVYQGPTYSWAEDFPVRHRCQFSWYCDGKSDRIKEHMAYDRAVLHAEEALNMFLGGYDFTNGATHYHAKTVTPYWAKDKQLIGQIDDHIFYRWN